MTSKTHRFTSCHRHPTKPVTGFCASCLRERLAGIESSSDDLHALSPPELRRTKSCSGGDPPASSAVTEPRRRSCEVLAPAPRNTLSDLFDHDDRKKPPNRNLDADAGLEITEERENNDNGPIRVCGDGFFAAEDDEETKTMKEFIDLELRRRKNAGRDFIDIAGSFCKRLRKWRRKQKSKKNHASAAVYGGGYRTGGTGLISVEIERNRMRGFRDTQSEVGEYGILGRRSCDTDPRLSIDAGRMSIDDSRLSFEAARASWDGYLIGRTSCPRFSPMVHVNGVLDERVLEEEEEEEEEVVNLGIGGENFPGGSSQTKDYYSDSLNPQRRRRSFDRSSSRRKPSMADVDELRVLSNAKVSPATSELFYGAKVLITEKDLREDSLKMKSKSISKSSEDVVQSGFVMGSASKDGSCEDVNQKGLRKLNKLVKMWNKFGLMHRRREDKMVDEDCGARDEVNKLPVAEPWQRLRRAVNVHGSSESVSQKLIRSYSVSCKNPCRMPGVVNGFGGHETHGSVLNGRQEFTLQRNRSVSYSPSNVDTGLLRFYLTPLKSYRRSRSGKSNLKD